MKEAAIFFKTNLSAINAFSTVSYYRSVWDRAGLS